MLQKLKRRNGGFTIIEVMIVLAIAGLIMLIVFLAVPALERSSRNTQRKNDVSNTLSSINTYTDNNGGVIPTAATLSAALNDVNLGYYTASDVFAGAAPVPTSASDTGTGDPTTLTTNDVLYWPGYSCASGVGSPPVPGSPREFALEYAVETGTSGATVQCLSS